MRFKNSFQKHKKRRAWKFYLRLSLATLIIGGSGLGVWRISAEERFYHRSIEAYEDNNLDVYNSFRTSLTSQTHQRFNQYLIQQAEQIVHNYTKNQLLFEEARDQLQRLQSFSEEPTCFLPYQEKIEQLKQSRQSFEEGELHAKAQDWEAARLAYSKVKDWDPNYEKAQKALSQVSRWELENYFVQTITHFEQKEYALALEKINKGLSRFPDNSDLIQLRQDVEKAMAEGKETLPDKWTQLKEQWINSLNQSVQTIQQGIQEIGSWIKNWVKLK